jgi:hypothetical protein
VGATEVKIYFGSKFRLSAGRTRRTIHNDLFVELRMNENYTQQNECCTAKI